MEKINITTEQRQFVDKKYYESSTGSTKLWKNFENIKIGFLGELVLCDFLKVPRPIIGKNGDKGYDIDFNKMKIDIKVNPTDYRGDCGRFIVSKDSLYLPLTHFLILMYRKNHFEIVGIVSKKRLVKIMRRCPHGCGNHVSFYCEYNKLNDFHLNYNKTPLRIQFEKEFLN